MASKRMKMSWLAQGTRIPVDRLRKAVATGLQLTQEELQKIEQYVGVSLFQRVRNSVTRTPP